MSDQSQDFSDFAENFQNFGPEIPEKNDERKHIKTITNIIYPTLAVFAFTCFAVLPRARAVLPVPDGCYPNFTTAEGCNALQFLTIGLGNTGVGSYSLFANSAGSFNTALGAGALDLNTASNNTATGTEALLLNTTGKTNT